MKTIFYRIYQLLIMAPVLLAATIVTALSVTLLSLLGMGQWAGNTLPRYWARLFCVMSMVRVTVVGRDNIHPHESYVFVCNHQGAYDIFSVYGYLRHPFRWMMKSSLEKIPLVGYSCKVSGHIMVDNSSPTATRRTMQTAERQLRRKGMSIVVFPEGARTHDGHMRRFKRGAYLLAEEFGLPVVPITINGSFDVMPRFRLIPHWGHITLTIHRPIAAASGRHDMAALIAESYETIHSDLDPRYK